MTTADESLCLQCGLCCDGTLFTKVPLRTEEAVPAELEVVVNEAGGRSFRQPCRALAGLCCTVYAQRPAACRGFVCLLLEAFRAGEVDAKGAAQIVAQAKHHLSGVGAPLHHARTQPATPELLAAERFLRFHFTGHRR